MPHDQVLRLDPVACDGHGICAELLPELVRLDEWGYPIIDGGAVPGPLRPRARQAAAACPTLALRLSRAEKPRPTPLMLTRDSSPLGRSSQVGAVPNHRHRGESSARRQQ